MRRLSARCSRPNRAVCAGDQARTKGSTAWSKASGPPVICKAETAKPAGSAGRPAAASRSPWSTPTATGTRLGERSTQTVRRRSAGSAAQAEGAGCGWSDRFWLASSFGLAVHWSGMVGTSGIAGSYYHDAADSYTAVALPLTLS